MASTASRPVDLDNGRLPCRALADKQQVAGVAGRRFGRRGPALARCASRQANRLRSILWVALLGFSQVSSADDRTIARIRPGDVYRVRTQETLKGYLELPDPKSGKATRLPIEGSASVTYRERAVGSDPSGGINHTVRIYDPVDSRRRVGGQDQVAKLRDEVRRIVVHRRGAHEIPYSLDGPLTWPEIDLLSRHAFVPMLEAMLPERWPTDTARWQAPSEMAIELTGLDRIESGTLRCGYNGTIEHKGATLGQFAFAGTLIGGTNEGRARDRVRGAAYVDVAKSRLTSLRAIGTREILDADERVVGRLEVDYRLIVELLDQDSDPTEGLARRLPTEPSPDRTALLYDNPVLGLRLLHPRRWLLASVERNRLTMRARGGSLVVTVEPAGTTLTARSYRDEVIRYLDTSGFTVTDTGMVTEENIPTGTLGRFRVDAVEDGEPMSLEYRVVNSGGRSATLAARFPKGKGGDLVEEVDRIAGDIVLTAPTPSR